MNRLPKRRLPISGWVMTGLLMTGLLMCGMGMAQAVAGSLPEPIIDPTMGAASAQMQGQLEAQTAAQPSLPQRKPAVQGAGSLQTLNRPPLTTSAAVPQAPSPTPGAVPTPRGTPGNGMASATAHALPPPSPLEASLQETLQMLALAGARQVAPTQARVEVELGRLDPRLRLAPCDQIQPYLPPNQRMWGRTRIGIRCLSGPTKWNVSLPLTIRVFAPAYVAMADLPVGTLLTQEHLRLADTDIAGEGGVIFSQPEGWVGRHLAKGLMAGEALRSTDLKLRQWVQPGDRVQVQAAGQGYAVSGEGQAMGVGLEGQEVRIRFDNGRMVTGRTVGERKVEVLL
ncbi:flagellar basal body P-ring formation chaperone FlgA [Roseateles sp. SL47]|uniref:flagellar basal body P-ring formation chaperone FlgA n=1 Tax=Roseateles sp. SL47 TaxID=2995138 RepID=UPI00226F5FCD|nr:flagellar basal body P-ring formation chaperone FlgA [Roseateles sp. SL47]WAC72499.1 flagellar basal body P-ring formation chaperone FlgA [Roseateles sp. SL47]